MMPIASFLALNTYHKPTILVPGGQSTSFYITASINVLYSSAIPIFHITQLARFIASCKVFVLQLRNLSVGLGEEPCIGFTQENSMENSLQELSLLIYIVTLVHATTMLLLP